MVLSFFMTKQPLVSIIMNCFNSETYLEEAIESVFNQNFDDWEIIFWDNLSTDKSAVIANSYGHKLKYYLASKHTELGVARNLALNKASGKYIGFLDCDDLYLKNKLKNQINFMEENRHYSMSYGSSIIINDKGTELKRRITKNKSGNIFGNLLKHYEISMQTVIIKKSILDEENLSFDTKLKFNPDFNLFMKIASSYPVGVLEEPLGKYRVLDDSLSSKTIAIAGKEIKYTLDELYFSSLNLVDRYKVNFKQAYDKLHYYDAVYALYRNNRDDALRELRPVVFSRIEYFILYLLVLSFVPLKVILKIIGR